MKHQHILLCCVLLIFTSCYISTENFIIVDHYPLTAGNQWHYLRQISIVNFRPAVNDTISPETTMTFTTDVNILGKVLLNGSEAWKVQTIEHENDQIFIGYDFYLRMRDSLRLIAYTTPTVTIEPMQKFRYPVSFRYQGLSFSSFTELLRRIEGYGQPGMNASGDSLYYEEGPVTSFVFPVRIISAWDYRLPNYPPRWRIHKKVIGTSLMTVNNISHPTYTIQWFWDTNQSGLWNPTMDGYEYFSSSGILRREFIAKNLVLTSSSLPEDTLGLFDVKDDYTVQTMSVH